MNSETHSEVPKTNEEYFQEIATLLAEGWKFEGNSFEQDQTYRLVVSKDGEEDRIFNTTKPYPEMFDSAGKTRDGS
jgi:hypothetical protein